MRQETRSDRHCDQLGKSARLQRFTFLGRWWYHQTEKLFRWVCTGLIKAKLKLLASKEIRTFIEYLEDHDLLDRFALRLNDELQQEYHDWISIVVTINDEKMLAQKSK